MVHHAAQALRATPGSHHTTVVFATQDHRYPPEGVDYELLWAWDLSPYLLGERLLNPLSVYNRVRNLMSTRNIDILHGMADEALLLPWLAGQTRGGLVMSAHHPYYPKLVLGDSLKHPRSKLLHQSTLYFQRYAFLKARRVLAVSEYGKRNLVSNMGVPEEKIEVVYNGAPPECFAVRHEPPVGCFTITLIGRLEPQKGVDTLLQALPIALKGNQRIEVLIVGDSHLRPQYEQQAENSQAASCIRFTGWLPHQQVRDILSRTNILVLPSRWENFPLTLLEAMAVGVPVLTTPVGGIPELVTDGESGLLVPPENPRLLGEALRYAMDNPARMASMAMRAREKVEANFHWEKVVEQYCAVYESLL
jgi:glycosyltransferase involved in cell wall biosynthesis